MTRSATAARWCLAVSITLLSARVVHAQRVYYPGPGDDWERRSPTAVGMDSTRLQRAIDYALDHPSGLIEARTPEEMKSRQERMLAESLKEPDPYVLGPMKPAKGVNGVIVRHGYIVAKFGDTKYVDLTASLTKSILSTAAGVTFDHGLIRGVHDPIRDYVHDGGFDSPHNAKITWHHMLQQTSEWEGTLWGKPDLNDRRTRRGTEHELQEPGTFWDYNDVRVNQLSLALLRLWKHPLPEVLEEYVMDPIGASDTWDWYGYDNSWVTIRGRKIQSVSGGAHWGGGFWVSAEDLARLGLLYLRRGRWRGEQLISERWITMATTPAELRKNYGYLWWLNTDGNMSSKSPSTAFAMRGGGGFYCWIDPENDLVVVVKALGGNLGEFMDLVMESVTAP